MGDNIQRQLIIFLFIFLKHPPIRIHVSRVCKNKLLASHLEHIAGYMSSMVQEGGSDGWKKKDTA